MRVVFTVALLFVCLFVFSEGKKRRDDDAKGKGKSDLAASGRRNSVARDTVSVSYLVKGKAAKGKKGKRGKKGKKSKDDDKKSMEDSESKSGSNSDESVESGSQSSEEGHGHGNGHHHGKGHRKGRGHHRGHHHGHGTTTDAPTTTAAPEIVLPLTPAADVPALLTTLTNDDPMSVETSISARAFTAIRNALTDGLDLTNLSDLGLTTNGDAAGPGTLDYANANFAAHDTSVPAGLSGPACFDFFDGLASKFDGLMDRFQPTAALVGLDAAWFPALQSTDYRFATLIAELRALDLGDGGTSGCDFLVSAKKALEHWDVAAFSSFGAIDINAAWTNLDTVIRVKNAALAEKIQAALELTGALFPSYAVESYCPTFYTSACTLATINFTCNYKDGLATLTCAAYRPPTGATFSCRTCVHSNGADVCPAGGFLFGR